MARLPILLYHDLESEKFPSDKTNPATKDTVVHVNSFENQIKFLADGGYQSISVEEFFRFRNREKPIQPKTVIITFDDGHYSNYHLAFPILQKYGLTATFFVIADRINQKYHLSVDQIKEMATAGMEFGSHGMTHGYLPLVDAGAVGYELHQSKNILEEVIRKPVKYFAFPGGHYNRNVLKLLSASGYEGACSCIQGLNDERTQPFLLRRLEIRKKFSASDMTTMFEQRKIAFYKSLDLCKSLAKQCMGLEAYAHIRSKLYNLYPFKR